jgi:hypothetical protein
LKLLALTLATTGEHPGQLRVGWRCGGAIFFSIDIFNSYATVVCCRSFFVPYAENPPRRI